MNVKILVVRRKFETISLEAELIPDATYAWEKDGVALTNTGNIIKIPSAIASDSGKYRLTILTADPKDCPIIGEASIEVVLLPDSTLLALEQCDIDENTADGLTTINLKQVNKDKELDFTFYETLEDQANKNSITNPESYTNTKTFTQTIFYEVTNRLGCKSIGEIALIVNPTVINTSEFSPFLRCNENDSGMPLEATFDLFELQIAFNNSEVAFYKNLKDASLEENPINEIFRTSNTTIYTRTENENQCVSVEKIELIVNPLPEINLDDVYQVCSDGEPILITGPVGFDSYTWYRTNTTQLEVVSTESQIIIADGGDFRLEVGLSYGTNNQSIQCKSSIDFEVISSNRATFNEITIKDLSSNNSISALVSGDGEYEFSLDGQVYQSLPLFENLVPGFYTVFARDLNGCGITEKEVVLVGYPKFFTPNGDGHNDTWQLTGSGKNLLEGEITIYDRYGKLIRQLDAEKEGWDGTFNGQILPPSDYWFRIALVNGKEFQGHFTLKR